MSHYPSSAELAAFRWPWPRTAITDPMVTRPTLWELRYGTVRDAGQRDFAGDPARHSVMRAEASAMRSRAFDRIFGDSVTWPEVTAYAPEPYGEDTVSCDVCGHFECAADLTTDWNGDTGAHLSCEALGPLARV